MKTRVCTKCRKKQSITKFSYRSGRQSHQLQTWCTDCTSEVSKRWKAKNKSRSFFWRLNYHYGVSKDTWKFMLKLQNGVCAICTKKFNKDKKEPVLDHCHRKQVARGLLCQKCNKGIGHMEDDIDTLSRAVIYLNRSNKPGAA